MEMVRDVRFRISKTGLLFCGTIMMVAAALVAAQDASQADKGEQLMNGSCLACHDLRPIQVTSLDSEGWKSVVGAMVEKGAPVTESDLPVLVEYLARTYGPLPDGAGKKILLNTCTVCHDLQRVRRTALDREGWEDLLGAMLNEGAMLSEQDFPVLLNYLARNFKTQ
jgi:cytochrome c5